LETLHPLCELSFVDTPLATDSKGGQFLSLDHPMHGSPGQLQHVSGLLKCQQAHRSVMVIERCSHERSLSNGNAIALLSRSGRFLEKPGALSYAGFIPFRGFRTNRSTTACKTGRAIGFNSRIGAANRLGINSRPKPFACEPLFMQCLSPREELVDLVIAPAAMVILDPSLLSTISRNRSRHLS
jgi:hypothetical protein